MSDDAGAGKLHIDSDWKAEAEQEKERLVAEEQSRDSSRTGPIPAPTILDLLNMIAMPAAMALGGYRTADGATIPPDLEAAKYHIDLLGLLQEKTQGHLTPEESKSLAALLHELRMQFTHLATHLSGPGSSPPKSRGSP